MCLSWRNEDIDIVAGYPNNETRYRAELKQYYGTGRKYSKCAQTLDETFEDLISMVRLSTPCKM